jgi:hypothetical protein
LVADSTRVPASSWRRHMCGWRDGASDN